jgi:hypothetical protein
MWILMTCLVLGCAACTSGRDGKGLYDVEDEQISIDEQAVADAIAQLAQGRDPEDAEASMAFDEAVQKLTLMGSTIEPYLIEALVGNDDWAVRNGVIHVLDSIGSKNCVTALIGALADEHPLVVQKAMFTLRVFCQHQEVPETGPVNLKGLAPIPARAADDLREDADYQIWLAWQRQYGAALHAAWQAWWDENLHLVRVE